MSTLKQPTFHFRNQVGFYSGKVRDVYNINNQYLVMHASDRISAFDVILPRPIPYKGQVLNQIAAHFLLATNDSMANLRGKLFHYGDHKIPLRVTYHPAYLLRAPREKRKAWQDMQWLKKQLAKGKEST